MTNACVYDCAYCVNRSSNGSAKAILTPDEIAGLTFEFYTREREHITAHGQKPVCQNRAGP